MAGIHSSILLRGLLSVALLILSLPCQVLSEPKVVTLRADLWDPYNGDPNAPRPGYLIEVAKLAFAMQGMAIDYQLMPWTRAIREAEEGRVDGIVGAAKGDAPHFIFPEVPQVLTRDGFFTLASSPWSYSGKESLMGVKVGRIADYSYGDLFDKFSKERAGVVGQFEEASGDEPLRQLILMLRAGRVDVVVSAMAVFHSTVDSMKLDPTEFRSAGVLPDVDEVFIAFSPKNPNSQRYAQILGDGTRALEASGKLQELRALYKVGQ